MPQFVILEHRWHGVHWDLMLEVGDVLKTWAIDEPIVAGRELPARRLDDHRRHYLDYEGPVSGGRGSVRRIAQGSYKVREWTAARIAVRLEGVQLAGEAELRKLETGDEAGTLSWILRLGNFD